MQNGVTATTCLSWKQAVSPTGGQQLTPWIKSCALASRVTALVGHRPPLNLSSGRLQVAAASCQQVLLYQEGCSPRMEVCLQVGLSPLQFWLYAVLVACTATQRLHCSKWGCTGSARPSARNGLCHGCAIISPRLFLRSLRDTQPRTVAAAKIWQGSAISMGTSSHVGTGPTSNSV